MNSINAQFGSVATDAESSYVAGKDEVFVSFRSSNPRNNQHIESTFSTVDRMNDGADVSSTSWVTKYVDGDWCTRFVWEGNLYLGTSFAHITWTIPKDVQSGQYRICHYGTRKSLWDRNFVFEMLENVNIGSAAVQGFAYLFDSATSFLSPFRRGLEYVMGSHLKDFQGCSSTFTVTVQ